MLAGLRPPELPHEGGAFVLERVTTLFGEGDVVTARPQLAACRTRALGALQRVGFSLGCTGRAAGRRTK